MMMTIDVDLEVYKALNRLSDAEKKPYNAILRDLLKVKDAAVAPVLAQSFVTRGDSAAAAAAAAAAGEQARPRKAPENPSMPRVAVLGAAGSIGAKVVDEALSRGLQTIAIARDPSKVPAREKLKVIATDANDPAALSKAIDGADLVVVSVKWAGADINKVLEGVRASGVRRAIVVVGCGTLMREDGRRHFIHAAEANGVAPPATVPAMRVMAALKASPDLEWTAISCPMDIRSGARTEKFRVGGEYMILDDEGVSRISEQDFAVAILDETQAPRHVRAQFGVSY
ncbi:MAG: NAD(P)-dependent oxidoreductase [Hyphomonadaceae bacterium]